jgi:hypothetical protein
MSNKLFLIKLARSFVPQDDKKTSPSYLVIPFCHADAGSICKAMSNRLISDNSSQILRSSG